MPNDTAVSSFTITAKTRAFQLDPQGKGVCTFTITNSGKAALEGRVRLTPTGQNPAVAEWLTITEPVEQAYKPNEERAYSVNIAVPPDAPGGTYLFRAEAYSVANPNDDYVGGPEFSFTIMRDPPPTASRGFPLWIPFTGLALVIAIAALVAVFVFSGSDADEPTTVPKLVGQSESEATRLLVEARLTVGDIERKPTAEVPEGQIIAQSPEPDQAAEAGAVVSLVVAAKVDTPMVAVPDLIGKTVAEAQRILVEKKLKPGVVGEDPDAAGTVGSVVQQSPAVGANVGLESEVSLVVKAKPAPAGPPVPAWQGSFSVRQTWSGDIDAAKECDDTNRHNADFWFHAVTATERYLEGRNGAVFGFPSEPTLASCRDAIAVAPVLRIALASLKPDKLIAVRTNLGRYVLISLAREVGPSPATLELRYQRFILKIMPVRTSIDFKTLRDVKPQSVQPTVPLKSSTEFKSAPAPAPTKPTEPRTAPRSTFEKPVLGN
jgi:hypothetical protein